MTSTILASYFAFLFNTGAMPTEAPAPVAKPAIVAVAAAKPAPVKPAIVVETENRDRGPAATNSFNLGAEIVATTAGSVKVATAPTAAEVVDEVQKFYKDIKQVTAKFRQEVTNATFGKSTTSDGKVWIKKPGMMRWDYYSKPKKKAGKKITTTMKSFISNGSYLYVVEHQNKQVIEKDLSKNMLPVAVTFLYGKGDLKADFDAVLDTSKKYGAKTDFVLKLTPKTPSAQYKNLYLVIDKDNYRVKQSVIIDSAGNINNFRFYEPDFEKAVEDSWFKFDKKAKAIKNYRIITDDDDQPPPSGKATGSGTATKKTDVE